MNTSELQKIKQKYTIVGNCDALNYALDVALQVAPTDLSVLITGESGVGKEVLPRIIHDNSRRKREKYFAINCGSIPEGTIDSELFGHEKGAYTDAIGESLGYFGAADKGTLFLDEVGELPMATQARLLRVLETGEYIRVGGTEVRKTDVRIVAATNLNLKKAISERRFREDLYFRLNTIPIQMPPLRERGNDIISLFRLFALQIAEKLKMDRIQLTEDAQKILLKYKWPGNVRQLKNITEQMSVMSQERLITPDILLKFIPDDEESYELATIPHNNGNSYENEREMLYHMLFDMKNTMSEISRKVHGMEERLNIIQATSGPNNISTSHISNISSDDYAEEVNEPESVTLNSVEEQMIRQALERNEGNRKKTASELGMSDRTLYRRIKQYGIEV